MSNPYKHFVITRFNLRVEEWKTTKNAEEVRTEEWLKNRFELFERYCLPSVKHQSSQNFLWYVFFDIDTPENYRKRVEKIASEYPNFRPLYIDGLGVLVESVTQQIKEDLGGEAYIITTRMDNDDIIHEEFIATIQSLFTPAADTVIDIREGYQVSIDKKKTQIREYTHPFNAFVSVIEKSDHFSTILSQMHYDWAEYEHITVYDAQRLWIELVHQKNKMNATLHHIPKIQGLPHEKFALDKNEWQMESNSAILCSNLMLGMRKSLISVLKSNRYLERFARKVKGWIS